MVLLSNSTADKALVINRVLKRLNSKERLPKLWVRLLDVLAQTCYLNRFLAAGAVTLIDATNRPHTGLKVFQKLGVHNVLNDLGAHLYYYLRK